VGPLSEDQLSQVYRSATKGPVPTDPDTREASRRLIEYRLAQTRRVRTSNYVVFGLFIVLGIYLVLTSGPVSWLSVALFAGILGLTHRQSVRLREQAALFGIDSTESEVPGMPGPFDIRHLHSNGTHRSIQLMNALIKVRWWALTAGAVMVALTVARMQMAHGRHGVGEAVLAAIFLGCSLWGFIGKSRIRRPD